jgi:hypothetical protein
MIGFGKIQKLQNDIFCLTEERDYFQAKFLEQVSELQAMKEELFLAKREITKLRKEVMMMSYHHHHHHVDIVKVSNSSGSGNRKSSSAIRSLQPRHAEKHGNDDDDVDDDDDDDDDNDDEFDDDDDNDDDDDDDDDDDASSLTSEEQDESFSLDDDQRLDAGIAAAAAVSNPSEPYQDVSECIVTPCKRRPTDGIHHQQHDNDNDDDDAYSHDSAKDIRQSAEKLLHWASYRASTCTSYSRSVAGSSSHYSGGTGTGCASMKSSTSPNIQGQQDEKKNVSQGLLLDLPITTTSATTTTISMLGNLEQPQEHEDPDPPLSPLEFHEEKKEEDEYPNSINNNGKADNERESKPLKNLSTSSFSLSSSKRAMMAHL